jgi:hypothetical protein
LAYITNIDLQSSNKIDIEQIYLGFITKSKSSGVFPLIKVERKSLSQLSQIFNTSLEKFPKNLLQTFKNLQNYLKEGTYALHKGPFKVDLVVYQE